MVWLSFFLSDERADEEAYSSQTQGTTRASVMGDMDEGTVGPRLLKLYKPKFVR